MQSPFDFPHLDPSCDPPEQYVAALELLVSLWGQLRAFRPACHHDEFLSSFTAELENELVAAGLLLAIQVELMTQ